MELKILATKKETVKESTFTKLQLINSKKYKHRVDLLEVLLQDDKRYSISDVDKEIQKFMKGSVK